MIKTEILQRDEKILRERAKNIPVKDIGSKKILNIIDRMSKALHAEEDGVAIAAPQIGVSLCLFVVSGKVLALNTKLYKVGHKKELKDLVFINPQITKSSKKKKKVEEGCLSVRWLYGQVRRSEKVTLKAYDETGKKIERGASGLLAQVFQHEVDHLNGVLFIDKAENIQDIPPQAKIKYVFWGSSQFSKYVLDELEMAGLFPIMKITSAKDPLPIEKLKEINADVFVVASFGKILPKEIIEMPKYKTLNVHPSLLPELRGPAPIQNTILGQGEPGITIIRMDEKMDHGPIILQAKVNISPWPDHYRVVEEKLGLAGGRLLSILLPKWVEGKVKETPQDNLTATYIKFVKKEDGLINLDDSAEANTRKVLAYSTWPGAYMFYKNKKGKEVRVIVKDAVVKDSKFLPTRVIPAGKREMDWQDFLRGN